MARLIIGTDDVDRKKLTDIINHLEKDLPFMRTERDDEYALCAFIGSIKVLTKCMKILNERYNIY